MKKGKGKGSNFERELCRILSLWWSENKRDDLFWRSAGSGAMAKVRSKVGKSTFGQYGDIQAVDPIGQTLLDIFTIEAKRGYNSDDFFTMLDKKEDSAIQMWEKFLNQVQLDTKNSGSISWMLIWKKDRKKTIMFLPISIIKQLKKLDVKINTLCHLSGTVQLKNGERIKVFSCVFEDFLNLVSPETIRGIK